jgi:hypothetical protein
VNLLHDFVAASLGEALKAATILQGQGYATLERGRLEENRLQITPAGVAEAARLGLPFWRRWLADAALVRQIAAGAVGALIGVIGTSLTRLLW